MMGLLMAGCAKQGKDMKESVPEVDVSEVVVDSVTLHKEYPGSTSAISMVNVVGRVSGTILRQLYTPGDYVAKGTPLFIIDSSTYENAMTEARSQLATAKSEYDYYTRQYSALCKAYSKDAVSEMEVLQTKSNMQQAEAAMRSAEAAISDAALNIGYCTVRAPIAGYMSENLFDPGTYISAGETAVTLATIYDSRALNVEFNIDDATYIELFASERGETNRPDLTKIPMLFSDQIAHSYTGRVTYLAPNIDTSTGTLLMKAEVANPHHELRPGMYVTVKLPCHIETRALLVRDASISTDQRGNYLYVVNDSNQVVYTPVKVGELYHDTLRVVESGINAGDRYVSAAMLKVRPGMKVKPISARKP